MKLSFSTGTLYHLPLRIAFELAHEAGFEGVELVVGPEVLLRGAAYVYRLTQKYSLPVLSVHPPILPYPGCGKVWQIVPRLIALARGVHCDVVVLHPPKAIAEQEEQWVQFTEALLEQRNSDGPQIAVENPGIFQPSDLCYWLHDIERLSRFADHHDIPLTFDTAHAGTSPYGLLEAYALVKDRVVNVHFSDLLPRRIYPDWPPLYSFFTHHQMPGQGVLPLAQFAAALMRDGYQGSLTLEVSPTALGAWSLGHIRGGMAKAIRFMRSVLPEAK